MQPANAQQREYWNSVDSREWVVVPHRYDEMLAPFAECLVAAAAPGDGERVLDVGCGNGATTLMFAERLGSTGAAVGIDLSEGMIENARARASDQRIGQASFRVADAQVDDLGGPYDAAVSRFGVMFFEDPDAACANVASELRPGGRITFVCWRTEPENEWVVVQQAAVAQHVPLPEAPPDAPGPFRYGDPALLLRSLERAGLADVAAEPVDVPILLGGHGTFDDVVEYVANTSMLRRMLANADDEQRARVVESIPEALAPYQTDDGVRLGAAAWIVSARRR